MALVHGPAVSGSIEQCGRRWQAAVAVARVVTKEPPLRPADYRL
jgi:hypothetical protein